ncbi:MAG: FkbM family methyltransferase [Cyanobacteria bacterium]|nr:FkbM family methyltransferase [Cyanobacteriota bacterium]MDW8202071.1 FkbM family methyltransferase [Cyanobacteriota bacterium SKYGB_h_bin112]
MVLSNYLRPEYLFRPSQVWRRVLQKLHPHTEDFDQVLLPWGLPLQVRSLDFIGLHIRWFGVFDLCVSEVIWRLLDSGDVGIDVGANLGYMTSLMAARVGQTGRIVSVEPHPELYQELLANVQSWKSLGLSNVHAENLALGNHNGEAVLNIPADFCYNRGLASIATTSSGTSDPLSDRSYPVQLRRLDDLVNHLAISNIGLVKIDVEGNELLVLEGASELVSNQQIRDIVFEDFGQYPTPVSKFLEQHGYTLFYLSKHFWGLTIGAIRDKSADMASTPEGPSYLATLEPERALARLQPWGWNIFRSHRFNRSPASPPP